MTFQKGQKPPKKGDSLVALAEQETLSDSSWCGARPTERHLPHRDQLVQKGDDFWLFEFCTSTMHSRKQMFTIQKANR